MKGFKYINGQKLITTYAGVMSVGVTVLLLSGFSEDRSNQQFDSITVQRINVVEPDGTLRMVLTNNNKLPGLIMNGHDYGDAPQRKGVTTAGILFYDAHATESGGLTFGGRKDGQNDVARFGHLSFDRHNQDQMLAIEAKDDGTNHVASIKMRDQPSWSLEEYLQLEEKIRDLPEEEKAEERRKFFATHPTNYYMRTVLSNENYASQPGSSRNMLHFHDAQGRARARLGVRADGTPVLEFLDVAGNVTQSYP
jgi:hypothetical protein